MGTKAFRRVVAVVLCVQPTFWMSSVALAQTLQQPFQQQQPLQPPQPFQQPPPQPLQQQQPLQQPAPFSAAPDFAFPIAPSEPDVARAARSVPTPASPPIDEPVDPDKYICGPGDVLELNFWGVQNFKQRVAVDLEGRAFVAKIGYLNLQGKTLSDARRVVRESVARYFPRLSFDVALAEPRTFRVQVVGAVVRPGSYAARAVDRIASLIAQAGGLGPNASKRRIEIRRRDGQVVRADLLLFTLAGDVRNNPYLLDGDVVRVPFEDLAASIDGAVNRPGRYELVGARDLAELVELAGGLAPAATQLLPVSVVRRLPDDRHEQKLLDFTPDRGLPSAAIQDEDSVRIPSFTELQRSVYVLGAIAGAAPASPTAGGGAGSATTAPDEASATRRLPFVEGDSVRTLLERVGGVGPLADLTGSYVLRDGESIPVDLYALVMLRDLKADRKIELGDTLVVPFKRRNIFVEGAVFRPGAYPYNPTFGIEQYLSLAGGRNRFARSISDVRVVAPNGETREFARDLRVEPGSSLVVPERNFSRSEVVQIILSAAGILLSGTALIITARQ